MSKHTPGPWIMLVTALLLIGAVVIIHTYNNEVEFKQKCEATGGVKISLGNSIRCFNKSAFIEVIL